MEEFAIKRWPAGAPASKGGEFAPKGGAGGASADTPLRKRAPITDKERAALSNYVESTFIPINDFLRNGVVDQGALDDFGYSYDQMKSDMGHLDSMIAKSELSEDITVYRGLGSARIKGDPKKLIGKIMPHPGYMSTSMSRDVAMEFSEGVLLEIIARKGTPAFDVASLMKSGAPAEQTNVYQREVLMPRGLGLKIKSVGAYKQRIVLKAEVTGEL